MRDAQQQVQRGGIEDERAEPEDPAAVLLAADGYEAAVGHEPRESFGIPVDGRP
ncbi:MULTISPECIES: hypothetical protein [Streptomyces]|uniref:hypothetical protein n=1 Tax=Streptomyces TaxID=1883 RepID=UPI001371CCA4|nr:hypothetical protein [Streptomyces sp. SID6139]MYR24567.1 hypothetical protein [Streptomyces sp. SID6137]